MSLLVVIIAAVARLTMHAVGKSAVTNQLYSCFTATVSLLQQVMVGQACLCCSDIWRTGLQAHSVGCLLQKHPWLKTSR